MTVVLGLGTAALLVVMGVSLVRVAWPTHVSPQGAEAVLVHAANHPWRLEAGLEIVDAGVAPVLVLSDVGGSYGLAPDEMAALCHRQEPYEVVCVRPGTADTLGEARTFGRVIQARGWSRVAVLTDRGHLGRARATVAQCTNAEVLPVASDPEWPLRRDRIRAEWLRLAMTMTFVRAC